MSKSFRALICRSNQAVALGRCQSAQLMPVRSCLTPQPLKPLHAQFEPMVLKVEPLADSVFAYSRSSPRVQQYGNSGISPCRTALFIGAFRASRAGTPARRQVRQAEGSEVKIHLIQHKSQVYTAYTIGTCATIIIKQSATKTGRGPGLCGKCRQQDQDTDVVSNGRRGMDIIRILLAILLPPLGVFPPGRHRAALLDQHSPDPIGVYSGDYPCHLYHRKKNDRAATGVIDGSVING
jgi:hypothetical protein